MSRCAHQVVRLSVRVVFMQCAMSVIAVQGVCRLHIEWVVVPISCERVFCDRVLRKELRWVPSCNGASMVFITRRRVAFKSDAVVRGTVGFLLQVISPRFCGMFSNYFPSVSREKTLLSCCTTRSMAKGVTERIRKYVYLILGVGANSVFISLSTCGLD